MRATDVIRELLCLIDVIDGQKPKEVTAPDPVAPSSIEIPIEEPAQEMPRRFKQIFDILSAEREQQYANSPAEVVASIDSVTVDAGGGWNGPKHPADLRVKDPSMYPNSQHRPE